MEHAGALGDVDGVIANSLKIGQGVQHFRHPHAFLRGKGVVGELHQVIVQHSLQLIQGSLSFVEAFQLFGVKVGNQLAGQEYVALGERAHLHDGVMGLFQSQGGGGQKALVQNGQGLFFCDAGDDALYQPDQQLMEGQQGHTAGHVETQMQVGNRAAGHGALPERKVEYGIAAVEQE